MPMASQKRLSLEEKRRELLARRRKPYAPREKKLITFAIEVCTQVTDESSPGRDVHIKVKAENSVSAIKMALDYLENYLKRGEVLKKVFCEGPDD